MKFEENLGQLERLVAGMESGDMKLDELMKAFEEGRKLADACSAELGAVRLAIEKVTKGGATEPFEIRPPDVV